MKTPACKGCGKCCEFGWKIEVKKEEAQHIPPGYLDYFPEDDSWNMKLVGKACIAFDQVTRTCRIYEDRPDICSGFEAGSVDCLEALNDK